MGGGFIPKKDAFHSCDDKGNTDLSDLSSELYIILGVLFVVAGFGCIIMSLCTLQLSARFLNFSSARSRFLSSNAYAVYLIHPLVLCPVAYSFALIQHFVFGSPRLEFCSGDTVSRTHFDGEWLIWVGWAYTVLMTVAIVWPV